MARLVLLLLGADYMRQRWRGLFITGCVWLLAGIVIFIDALDGALYFPIEFFAYLFLIEGLATLVIATTGVGGQRVLRFTKGTFAVLAAALILAGHHHGHFVLSMIFGALFLADGLSQCVAAYVVAFPRWRQTFAAGVAEILLAIFFFQPYPTDYVGTLPYCLGLFLMLAGVKLIMLARRVRGLVATPSLDAGQAGAIGPERLVSTTEPSIAPSWFDGPPGDHDRALTVHVWTPTGSSKAPTVRHRVIDRYIAAIDVNGVISTGHAALETPEGIYISLYPDADIDRSPDQFGRTLRATPDNNVPGQYQPSYAIESVTWCPSTVRVRIRNYNAEALARFWSEYRQDATYNLTYRNCSSSVSAALEAALDGAFGRLYGKRAGWRAFVRLLATPELWVASQIRKRATTMAWTPGLTLDYARAMSMLADPRPFGWWTMWHGTIGRMRALRRQWRKQDAAAPAADLPPTPDPRAIDIIKTNMEDK
ncbi:HdeD family acid-resistance protein [Schauerella aestuarii]|uniref:HdeD family acid-resistance protein n=1 Tax=Schauerella aestuarii TaxID=2511204 RepID=UPI00137017D7|nr:DUF308 domain-containing protein [Achromobacter aestuarii]MYZ41631.1 DUF308 domain-containing protein [Achromobacter aestuarii]